jgi:glucose-6-phosphate isomerase
MVPITLEGATDSGVEAILERLAEEDVLGQLLRRHGRMAELATEAGDVKLDWVDGVEKALGAPHLLRAAEQEAEEIVAQGIRHVIWSGMGGSVQTVYTLKRMGYLDQPALAIHPLDSTDPAALNRILAAIGAPGGRGLAEALQHTLMIGVSMGLTSEEPITHLEWFDGLLADAGLPDRGRHIQVMTLPGSYLDQFARRRGSRMVPIQLDAQNHTPGRMSAPATRVFLRPVALLLASLGVSGGLQPILQRGQDLYELSHSLSDDRRRSLTRRDPFLQLAAWLSLLAERGVGAPKLLVTLPPRWEGFAPWLEQLVEESLGKGGKGFLIFYDQSPLARYGDECAVLRIFVGDYPAPPPGPPGLPALSLRVPGSSLRGLPDEARGLGELAGLFLCFKKTVAAYGYLQDIVFAGQPAVEAYKRYARDLREAPGPVTLDQGATGESGGRWRVQLEDVAVDYSSLVRRGLVPAAGAGSIDDVARRLGGNPEHPPDVLAAVLTAARQAGILRYLDLTWNGELPADWRRLFERQRDELANLTLGIPAKVRTGPSDYHSTEQSETDGPPELVSIRLVAQRHEPVVAGRYDDKFLLAQARGTWQAMEDAGRWIVFITVPEASAAALAALARLFDLAARRLERPPASPAPGATPRA